MTRNFPRLHGNLRKEHSKREVSQQTQETENSQGCNVMS